MPGDFTIAVSPTTGSGNRDYTVTVTSAGGFMGIVGLSAAISPTTSCTIVPASVGLMSGGSAIRRDKGCRESQPA